MTIEFENGVATATIADDNKSSVARMAETAGSEASNVATTAAEGAKEIAGEATAQTKAVVSQAKQEVDSLITQTREEMRQLAESRSAQAAGGLRTLSEQVVALTEGRPESAGSLPRYLEQAQEQVRSLASRLEQGGPQAIIDDVTRFARRRPGLFLAGALGAGFVVGRLVRASSAPSQTDPGSMK